MRPLLAAFQCSLMSAYADFSRYPALNVLVINLEELQELLEVLFTALLHLLLINGGDSSIRTVPLKPQIAAA